MQIKTRGIIFGSTRYGDSSMIARIYTEELGLRAFMLRGARKRRSSQPVALLQPLNLVELEARVRESADLHHITEIRLEHPYSTIPFDITRSTQLIFLNELLVKSIRMQEKDSGLFSFLHHSLCLLDLEEDASPVFHLVFALRLSRFLGFQPSGTPQSGGPYFDLLNGSFCHERPSHTHFLGEDEALAFSRLLGTGFEDMASFREPKVVRRRMTEAVIEYFRLHTDSFGTFRSAEVLETVLG